MSDAQDAFVKWKSHHTGAHALRNMQRLEGHPCATHLGRPFLGRHVLVMGAGYELIRNLDGIREHVVRGGPLIAVNKSAVVCAKNGITPTVVVARESVDVSEQVAMTDAPVVCVDISAHPHAWTAAGDRLAFFIPGYPRQFHLAACIEVVPTFGGTAAFTTAVHLARIWGAAAITLVGAGNACEVDESGALRRYHPDAPRGSVRGELVEEDEGMCLRFTGDEDDQALAVRSGQRPQPTFTMAEFVSAADWSGLLPTIAPLVDEIEWLIEEARRWGKRIQLRDASEGGTGKPGWLRCTLADAMRDAGPPPLQSGETAGSFLFDRSRVITAREQRRVRDLLLREAIHLADSSVEILNPRGPDLVRLRNLPGLVEGSPLVESLASHKLVDLYEHPVEPGVAVQTTYTALLEAAARARGILAHEPSAGVG